MEKEKNKKTEFKPVEGIENKNIKNKDKKNEQIIQEGNSYYEIDLECMARKKKNQETMEYRRK